MSELASSSISRDVPHDVLVTVNNRIGSVQHYYHFILGFLLPLVGVWDELIDSGAGSVFVRSCAIMDALLLELRLPGLVIVPESRHRAMAGEARGPSGVPLRLVTIDGRDHPQHYDSGFFAAVRQRVCTRLAADLERARVLTAARFTAYGPRMAMIRRAPADPFYASAASEIKTAGTQRRSIANFAALTEVASTHTDNLLVAELEGCTLAEQVALFSQADIVIAQHGAALANLVWSPPGQHVIEIVPRELEASLRGRDFFGDLAARLGLRLTRLWQSSPHGPVDPHSLRMALEREESASGQV